VNKRAVGLLCLGILLLGAGLVYWFAQGSAAPTVAPVTAAAPQVAASLPVSTPVTTVVPPKVLPSLMAKIKAEVHHTPMHRPMTVVAKNWLACQSADLYNATEAQLERQDPAVSAQFQGDPAPCLMLMQGQHIRIAHQDADSTIIAVHIDGGSTDLWTDAAALADHVPAS